MVGTFSGEGSGGTNSKECKCVCEVCCIQGVVRYTELDNHDFYFYSKHEIYVFELWCWRRLLRVPWTAKRSNQSILKESIFIGRTDAEAPIFWPPDAKSCLTGKDPNAGKD